LQAISPSHALVNNRTTRKPTLDDWVELIRRQNMPVFDATVQQIINLSRDDQAPIAELAGVILRDASLTARVLKLANSIYHNPTGASISTVTRAVIVLGFNAVLNICLALTLVDALREGAAKERLGRELGRAMHAATQARALAAAHGDRSPEEVFIATLLYRIGELAFWCFSGEVGQRIEQLTEQPGVSTEQAEERVLGFRLSQLSRQLVRDWRLTDLLQEAIAYPARKDSRIQAVMLGQQIARCAAGQGWHSNEMEKLVLKAATLTQLPAEDARSLLFEKAEIACAMANDFGAAFAAAHIPLPGLSSSRETGTAPSHTQESGSAAAHPSPDHALQLRVMRELASLLEEARCDFNIVMELVLEGIYRGVGTDRVLLALTSPDKQILKGKYSLGEGASRLNERFQFIRTPKEPNALFQVMDSGTPQLLILSERSGLGPPIATDLAQTLEAQTFMVAPVLIHRQCVGLIYADRALSGRALDTATFEEFKQFVQQGNQGLVLARSRTRQG
jgi:HD-like signal output (HDOD) protein